MKFRTDFVTNSSSSSFILMKVKSKTLFDVVKNNEEFFTDEVKHYFTINDKTKTLTYEEEEGCFCQMYLPKNTVPCLVDAIINFYEEDFGWWLEDEKLEQKKKFINELKDNKKEIIEDLQKVDIKLTHYGWGEDEERFEENSYTSRELKKIYQKIAEINDCNVEDVDYEMFNDYVLFKSSTHTTNIKFDEKTKKVTEKTKMEL